MADEVTGPKNYNRTRLSVKGMGEFLRWVEIEYGFKKIADLTSKADSEIRDMVIIYVEDMEERRLQILDGEIERLKRKKAVTQRRLSNMRP